MGRAYAAGGREALAAEELGCFLDRMQFSWSLCWRLARCLGRFQGDSFIAQQCLGKHWVLGIGLISQAEPRGSLVEQGLQEAPVWGSRVPLAQELWKLAPSSKAVSRLVSSQLSQRLLLSSGGALLAETP